MDTLELYATTNTSPTLVKRVAVLIYSVVTYLIGVTAFAWLVALLSDQTLPLPVAPHFHNSLVAIGINLGLLLLFGMQHSVMARSAFKRWLTRWTIPATERSSYIFASGIALGLLVWLWQPLDGIAWSVSQPVARVALWILFACSWMYLVAATYVTNHYDLFGLRQAWLYLRGVPYTPVPFVRAWMYRYSRHPMMAGILFGVWLTPDMTFTHLMLAIGLSVYIVFGVAFEERELLSQFGEKYAQYRKQVGVFLTFY